VKLQTDCVDKSVNEYKQHHDVAITVQIITVRKIWHLTNWWQVDNSLRDLYADMWRCVRTHKEDVYAVCVVITVAFLHIVRENNHSHQMTAIAWKMFSFCWIIKMPKSIWKYVKLLVVYLGTKSLLIFIFAAWALVMVAMLQYVCRRTLRNPDILCSD